jgi:hypothetical protein
MSISIYREEGDFLIETLKARGFERRRKPAIVVVNGRDPFPNPGARFRGRCFLDELARKRITRKP